MAERGRLDGNGRSQKDIIESRAGPLDEGGALKSESLAPARERRLPVGEGLPY